MAADIETMRKRRDLLNNLLRGTYSDTGIVRQIEDPRLTVSDLRTLSREYTKIGSRLMQLKQIAIEIERRERKQ